MEPESKLGMNKTGFAMSPFDSPKVASFAKEATPEGGSDEAALALHRGRFVAEAERVGSVPPPSSVKGMVKSTMSKLSGNKPEMLIDKLGERLAFERAGTRLYDAFIAKVAALANDMGTAAMIDRPMGASPLTLETLRRNRDQEMRHFHLVADALEKLGADPTAQTPCADVTAVSSLGLMQVVSDPRTTVGQCLNALLSAELIDNAGWELLITLAEELGHTEMADAFRVALAEEQQHLIDARAWLREMVLLEGSGETEAGRKSTRVM